MPAGASAAVSTCVMTKCHSLLLHAWSVSAFAEISCVEDDTVAVDGVACAAPRPTHGTTASAATRTPATRNEVERTVRDPGAEPFLCWACIEPTLQDDDTGGGLTTGSPRPDRVHDDDGAHVDSDRYDRPRILASPATDPPVLR